MNRLLIKKIVASVLSVTGIQRMFARKTFRDRAFVLTYHRILPAGEVRPYVIQPGMVVSAQTFKKHVRYLKENFDVVFVDDLGRRVASGGDVGGCCAITFDDGWRDNFTHAFPILKEYAAPATIFLATDFVGTDHLFWPEEVSFCLSRLSGDAVQALHPPGDVERLFRSLDFDGGLTRRVDTAIAHLKRETPTVRDGIIRFLKSIVGEQPTCRDILTWDEVKEMQTSGLVRFGSHTSRHVILDQIPDAEIRAEVAASCAAIEHHLGTPVTTFAYPNGNYNNDIVALLTNIGITTGLTTTKGYVGRSTPSMEMPRIGVHEDISSTIPLFLAHLVLPGF